MTPELRGIPRLVAYNTEEIVCLHEAGHAIAAHLAGATVIEMELYADATRPYGRTSINKTAPEQGPAIAIGGFAIERRLWEDKRLTDATGNALPEKEMLDAASDNSDEDRINYFGRDHRQDNGRWPATMDREFMIGGQGLGRVVDMAIVERIATALLNERKLDQARIAQLLRKRETI